MYCAECTVTVGIVMHLVQVELAVFISSVYNQRDMHSANETLINGTHGSMGKSL